MDGVRALEVCSGESKLTSELCRRGVQAQGLDVRISLSHDVLLPQLGAEIRAGIVRGDIRYVHIAVPCNTFSPARYPKLRSTEYPRGLEEVSVKDSGILEYANRLTDELLALAIFGADHGCRISVENPYCSTLWSYDRVLQLMDRQPVFMNAVDYCMMGMPYKKPTKFLSVNLQLPSINVRCDGGYYSLPIFYKLML